MSWTPESGGVPPSASDGGDGLGCALLLALCVVVFVATVVVIAR